MSLAQAEFVGSAKMRRSSTPSRLVYKTNELWGSRVTGISHIGLTEGPDLMNNDVFIEVKSGKSKNNWTIVGKKQFEYEKAYAGRQGFLLLVLYYLSRDPNLLSVITTSRLEKCVFARTGYLLPFSATSPIRVSNGKNDDYKYPEKLILHHPVIKSYAVEKGTLHICQGADISKLNITGKELLITAS